jgi:hypothetical protein
MLKSGIDLQGRLEVLVTQGLYGASEALHDVPYEMLGGEIARLGGKLLEARKLHNILTNVGKDKVILALFNGTVDQIGRMACGDRGTLPSDSTVPKIPVATMTSLFNEVYRKNVDAFTTNVGTPSVHEVKFTTSFNAVDIPITAFSNQASPVINEVGLITFDQGVADLSTRLPVAAPATPLADERLFSIRTFKSVPFDAANEISVTIRYTIFINN